MKIAITKNGPYVADPGIPLKDVDSTANPQGGVADYALEKDGGTPAGAVYLCRCGFSQNKPYCDGHHVKVGFDGTETNDRKSYDEGAKRLPGAVYDLLDNESFCTAARFCDVGDSVWNAIERADADSVKYAEHVGCHCNGGRLTLVNKATGEKIEKTLAKEIDFVKDAPKNHLGPINVWGGIQVVGADGFEYEVRNRTALCRCGESSNKPFCDSTHLNCKHMEV
ncbi:MAG: CDGSH iron-sulfur domain-containing protein [Defluviitaleaceae bacterium]|nr:CDGSH iron-sulfur domain-containing protein [Defluviitaleaceae bacterium]